MNRVLLAITYYLLVSCTSCKQDDLFERLEQIPGGQWKSSFTPSFTFIISDTTAFYNVYVTVRHTNNYGYNNIWLQSSLQLPGDSLLTQKLDLKLAGTDGWLGTGMDDIFETRIKVTPQPQPFPHSGQVTFTLQQIMRQDPLPGVLQIGMRVEKSNQ